MMNKYTLKDLEEVWYLYAERHGSVTHSLNSISLNTIINNGIREYYIKCNQTGRESPRLGYKRLTWLILKALTDNVDILRTKIDHKDILTAYIKGDVVGWRLDDECIWNWSCTPATNPISSPHLEWCIYKEDL